MPITYTPIATNTLGSATATVTFSSIPATYTDLVIVSDNIGPQAHLYLQFNSDSTSSYSNTCLSGTGTAADSRRGTIFTSMAITSFGYPQATTRSFNNVNIQNYANSTIYKTVLTRSVNTTVGTDLIVGLWRKTAAITSVTISRGNDNFEVGSSFTLYGIKAA